MWKFKTSDGLCDDYITKGLEGFVLLFVALVVVLASTLGVNLYLRAGAEVTRGGDTIWLNRFAESGSLQQTLEMNCTSEAWAMCASAETIQAHAGEGRWFLFGADSPVNQIGWEKGMDEQREIVARAMTYFWQKIIGSSAQETWRQVGLLEIQPYVTPLARERNAVKAVRENFPREVTAFENSKQQTNLFMPTRLLLIDEGTIQGVSFVVALGLIGIAVVQRDRRSVYFLVGTLYFLLLNAAVMATFSGALTRYQGRVYWLLVYVVLVVGAGVFKDGLKTNLSKFVSCVLL